MENFCCIISGPKKEITGYRQWGLPAPEFLYRGLIVAEIAFFRVEGPFSVDIDPIMYRKSNSKSVAANSFLLFPPYFCFRFGFKCVSVAVFCPECMLNARYSLVDNSKAMMGVGRR